MEKFFELAGEPHVSYFFAGVLFGFATGWAFINKFILDRKLQESDEHCKRIMAAQEQVHAAQFNSLQIQYNQIAPIAQKWSEFMERKALEALDRVSS